jgi:DNA ligase-1
MREFARLYAELDSKPPPPIASWPRCKPISARARPEDAAWAVYFLAGGKPRQVVPTKLLRQYTIEYGRRSTTGCSTNAMTPLAIWPKPSPTSCRHPPASPATSACRSGWRNASCRCEAPRRKHIRGALFAMWDETNWRERFLLMKLIGGGFRVGVSRLLVTRALGEVAGIDAS